MPEIPRPLSPGEALGFDRPTQAPTADVREPRTEAGRDLVAEAKPDEVTWLRDAVLAIEDEARGLVLANADEGYRSPPTKAGTRAMQQIAHVCDKWGDTNIPRLIREVEEESYAIGAALAASGTDR